MRMVKVTHEEYVTLLNHVSDPEQRGKLKLAAFHAVYSGNDERFLLPVDILPPGWSYLVKAS